MRSSAVLLALAVSACLQPIPTAAPREEGRIYHYLRSNQDGTLPENIWVYARDDDSIEVYKSVERCANAALVTAELDRTRDEPLSLVGGRVTPDGMQEAFAWLDLDPDVRGLHARVPSLGVDATLNDIGAPWLLYDFDLADLTVLRAGDAAPRADFSFWTALVWPDERGANPLRVLGATNVRHRGEDMRFGADAVRYDVSGGLTGVLWLDADDGHVIEARFAEPNHPGYADFRLTLEGVSHGGEAEWRARLAAHWAGCPAEE
jgi:hypothetical protein